MNATKQWHLRSDEEKLEYIRSYMQYCLKKGFFAEKDSGKQALLFNTELKGEDLKLNQAFNPRTGKAYNGLNSTILDITKHDNGFKDNQWLGIEDLKGMIFEKGFKKNDEISRLKEAIKNREIPTCKIAFIRSYEFKRKIKRDEDNNPIQARDKEGNLLFFTNKEGIPIKNKEGEYIPQYEFETRVVLDKDKNPKMMTQDRDGNPIPKAQQKPFTEIVYEKVEIAPRLETKQLINIECINGLNKYFLKELDRASVVPLYTKKFNNTEEKYLPIVINELQTGKNALNPSQAECIKGYEKSKFEAKDYIYANYAKLGMIKTNQEAFRKAEINKTTELENIKTKSQGLSR